MSERLTVDGRRPPVERQRPGQSATPGRGPLIAVIVLTGLVLLFAAGIAFWMYWLQGALPS